MAIFVLKILKRHLTFLTTFFTLAGISQDVAVGLNYRQQLTGAYGSVTDNLTAAGRHQGSLAELKKGGITFNAFQPYSIKAGGSYFVAVAYPRKFGAFLVAADHIQYTDYRVMQVGLAYGMRFSSSLTGGVKLNYYNQSIRGYQSFRAFSPELSIMFALTPKLTTGITLYNPISIFKKKQQQERLTGFSAIGWRYSFSESFIIGLLISKADGASVIIHPFFSMIFLKRFYFKPGYDTGPGSWVISAGYVFQSLKIEINVHTHPYLGLSGGMGIQWLWLKNDVE